MTPAYDNPVSPRKWNLALLALAFTVFGGAALAFALLLGAANPPHAANLVYNARNADDFVHAWDYAAGQVFALPNRTLSPPLTIEMEASNSGATDSAWGLAFSSDSGKDAAPPVMIGNRGYLVTRVDAFDYAHLQFPHLKTGMNRISAHIDASGLATFRINDEQLRQQSVSPVSGFTVFLYFYGEAELTWESIRIYTG